MGRVSKIAFHAGASLKIVDTGHQEGLGWTDSHLHRFRTGRDHRSPYFVSTFDLYEGEEGVLEDDVRLDQLVGAEGDAIWYEHDFGDG